MDILLNIFYSICGVAGLYYGAEFLVKGGVGIARKAGISPLVIGLTLVAFATSAPELVVSVKASLSGNADISLGNVVGSNICNIALILGICACITPLAVQKQLLKFDTPIMIGASILLTIFYFSSKGLTRWQGLVLFAGFLAYTFWNIHASRKNNAVKEEEKEEIAGENGKEMHIYSAVFLVICGLALLIAGAEFFLRSAVFFAKLFRLSDAVIGLTIVAVGTSLPELATSIVAACKKESDIAIGNGSNIFNILGILGIAPIIAPMQNATLDIVDLSMMLLTGILLLPMMFTGGKLSRKEGALLLVIYCGYIAYLLIQHT